MLLLVHILSTRQQSLDLDLLVDRWRQQYHLTDEQVRQIREIEMNFHGSGNPFTRPSHTRAEMREHHREISAHMNPEDGARYLRSQEGVDPRHPHP